MNKIKQNLFNILLLLFLNVFLLFNVSCSNNNKIPDINKCQYIELLKEYKWDVKLCSEPMIIEFINEDTFFCTLAYESKINMCVLDQIENNLEFVMQIGRHGKGPGEYDVPYKLFINKHDIYYTDINSLTIEKINYETNEWREVVTNQHSIGSLYVDGKYLFVSYLCNKINNYLLNVYNLENNSLSDRYFKFKMKNLDVIGGDITRTKNGVFHLCHPQPFIIYRIDSVFNEYDAWDYREMSIPGFVHYTKEHYKKFINSTSMEEKGHIFNEFSKITHIHNFISNGKQYFIVGTVNTLGMDTKEPLFFYIINEDGVIIHNFKIDRIGQFTFYKNYIYVFDKTKSMEDSKNIYLKRYVINL